MTTTTPPGFRTLLVDTVGRAAGIRTPIMLRAPLGVRVIARATGGGARTVIRDCIGAVAHVHPSVVR